MDRRILRVWVGLCFAMLAVACGEDQPRVAYAEEPKPVPAPVIIDRLGVYSINGGGEVFTVEHLALGEAFGYRLGKADDMEHHGVGIIGDPQSLWFFHNSAKGCLWAYSEADGVSRWTQDPAGKWHLEHYDDSATELPDDMPMVFYERLPKHEKSRWVPDPGA